MAPILGYWNIRGLAEPIRYMLHYLGIKFEDKRYEFGTEANFWQDSVWNEEKYSLGLALPNIPYYFDGDVKLTQATAIMRYLARNNGLYYPKGKDEDISKFDMIEGHVKDLTTDVGLICYSPKSEEMIKLMAPRFSNRLKDTSLFLGENPWILGDQISHVDFMLYESLELGHLLFPNCLEGLDNLKKFKERFASIPAIQKYMETSKKWPFWSPMASIGGKGEAPQ